MSYENPGSGRWNFSPSEMVDAGFYNDLAGWCERLGPEEQAVGFDRVLREIGEPACNDDSSRTSFGQRVARLVEAEAFESAAIALLPQSAIYSGGRMKDGSFIAQVIPEGSAGAHSREAQSLAMAWIAALLRAMGRQLAEAKEAVADR